MQTNETTGSETTTTGESGTKSAMIRAELSAGNTKVSDIRKALEARGVEVSENLIHSVKQKFSRAANEQQLRPGVTRVRKEGAITKAKATELAPAARGAKKAAIIQLFNRGVTKASEIQTKLKELGIESSANNIYVVLSELKDHGKRPAKKPTPAKAPTAPKQPAQLRKVAPEAAAMHPDLVQLMQAAALTYGLDAVEKAASHVGQRSREMIQQTFRVA